MYKKKSVAWNESLLNVFKVSNTFRTFVVQIKNLNRTDPGEEPKYNMQDLCKTTLRIAKISIQHVLKIHSIANLEKFSTYYQFDIG